MSKRKSVSAERGEGKLLVELCKKHGWVFMPRPKVSLAFDLKAQATKAYYEYRVQVPERSALVALMPPKKKGARP